VPKQTTDNRDITFKKDIFHLTPVTYNSILKTHGIKTHLSKIYLLHQYIHDMLVTK
jgi:hypothetical protein